VGADSRTYAKILDDVRAMNRQMWVARPQATERDRSRSLLRFKMRA
jgi:hypothetical protein